MIDTHCHFDMLPNPEAFIAEREKAGDVVIGMTNLPSHFQMGYSHVRTYKNINLALGFHPLLVSGNVKEVEIFKQCINQTPYVGEIGLDFSKDGIGTKDLQIEVLKELFSTLRVKTKIISVHSRQAERELLDLLCEFEIENVIFHWYSGPKGLIPEILAKGYFFSINEAMTISDKGRSIIEAIPQDRILTETDAPFNTKSDIKRALFNMHMTKETIDNNFRIILSKMRYHY